MSVLLGVFDFPNQIAAAVTQLRSRGYTDIETYAPAPFTEVDDAVDEKPSRVRLFTLFGGLVGMVTGFAIPIWMANNWQLVLGGKPFTSIPPYTIISFELMVLFGGVLTVIGVFKFGKLPQYKLDPHYSARFSAEEFGLVVRCRESDVEEIDRLLRDHQATEVNLVDS